jgi:hypothetical protein
MEKHLLIVEHNHTEFIVAWFDSKDAALKMADQLTAISFQHQDDFAEYFREHFMYIRSYTINGTETMIWANNIITNGFIACSILERDPAEFDMRSFIRERENASKVFNWEDEVQYERYDRLIDLFPHFGLWAN